jgi:hypothetical protein
MATINGNPVNFGFTGTNGIAITGLSGTMLQTAEHTKQADLEVARNGVGDEVTHGWYNIHDEATLEWIVTDTTNIAGAITNTALQTPGTILVITACASMPSLVATTWEVQSGCKISGSNVTAKRISLPLKKYAGITGAAA